MKRALGAWVLIGLSGLASAAGLAGAGGNQPAVAWEDGAGRHAPAVRVPYDCYIICLSIKARGHELSKRLALVQAAEAILASNPPPALLNPKNANVKTLSESVRQDGPSATEREHLFVIPVEGAVGQLPVMKRVAVWFESLVWPKGTVVELREHGPGVRDPEAHRAQIVAAIARQVKETKAALGGKAAVRIDGLGEPVQVTKFSDDEAELSLPYSVTFELD
jgi:hypothetical protein